MKFVKFSPGRIMPLALIAIAISVLIGELVTNRLHAIGSSLSAARYAQSVQIARLLQDFHITVFALDRYQTTPDDITRARVQDEIILFTARIRHILTEELNRSDVKRQELLPANEITNTLLQIFTSNSSINLAELKPLIEQFKMQEGVLNRARNQTEQSAIETIAQEIDHLENLAIVAKFIVPSLLFLFATTIFLLLRQRSITQYLDGQLIDKISDLETSNARLVDVNAALTTAKREAEKASAAKTAFFAHVSHELRTPLNAIIGFSDLVQNEREGEIANKNYVDYARLIFRSGTHLLNMINDIIDITRIEAGHFKVTMEPNSLAAIADDTLSMLEHKRREKNITIGVSIKPEADAILCDHRAMIQVLVNIIGNAINYTPEGGEIWVKAERERDVTKIDIQDTGPGIPEHLREKIFRPFERLQQDGDSTIEGFGLGLPIAKSLAEHQGGELRLAPTSKGSLFIVRIKAFSARAADADDTADQRAA